MSQTSFSFNNNSSKSLTKSPKYTSNVTCVPLSTSYMLGQFIVSLTGVIILLFILLAIIVFRKKLRSRVVNIYAASVIAACALSCGLRFVDAFLSYFGVENKRYVKAAYDASTVQMHAWMVFKSLMLAMFVITAGGLGLVVNALRDNIFRINRTVAGVSFISKQQQKGDNPGRLRLWCHQHRRSKAILWVASSWILPLLCSLLVCVDNARCLQVCHCYFNYVPEGFQSPVCDYDSGCSYVWPPLSEIGIIIGACLWVSYVFATIALFVRATKDFRRVSHEITTTSPLEEEIKAGGEETTAFQDDQALFNPSVSPSSPNTPRSVNSPGATIKRIFFGEKTTTSLLLIHLKKNLRILGIISVIYIVGSGNAALIGLISISSNRDFLFKISDGFKVPLFAFGAVVETVVPVLLCLTLADLKSAVYSMMELMIYCVTFECFR